MTAYAAVISLKHTILSGLVNCCRISPVSSTREILEFAYNETLSLQKVVERFNYSSRSSRERVDALEGKIRDCAHKLEDVLEFHELNPQDERVRQEITSFGETVKKMKKEEELDDDHDDDDDDATATLIADSSNMVGNNHLQVTASIRNHLLGRMRPDDMCFFSIFGENGSGRTIVANTIFEAARATRYRNQLFDCYAWVTIAEHPLKEVLIRIISQVRELPRFEYEFLFSREEERLSKYLYKILENRRYMIVLDDVRHVEVVDYLKRTSLPADPSNGSIVFLTTNFKEVAQLADGLNIYSCEAISRTFQQMISSFFLMLLKNLPRPIPTKLEEVGKEIFQNCGGLHISAAKTVLLLMKTEKTVEEWSKIAADKQNPIFMVADEISEISKIKTEVQSNNWDIDDDLGRLIAEMISDPIHLPDFVKDIKSKMHPERFFSKTQIISLLGMAGIGKTTVARYIFKDESILCHFDHRVWVTSGPKYQGKEILIDILGHIYPNIDKLQMKGDENLVKELCEQVSHKRCLIILDDLWSKDPLHYLKNLFPCIKGTILVTTTLAKVAKFGPSDMKYEMQLLDDEESWHLLCQKVFGGGGLCPPELEKAGRKISERCEGLPLLILTVADQLLKVDISQECWNDVASGKQKSVFTNAHHQISKTLLPSYHSLPQHLKACFLYMGVFCQKYEIPKTVLTDLLIAEGFFESKWGQTIEDVIASMSLQHVEADVISECLCELVDRSLLLVKHDDISDLKVKTCRLHAIFWHLSNSQAVENKFFHAMNNYDDCLELEGTVKSQRRLCIRNSSLLGMKKVQNSMASITSAHSLLCVGPLHQYPVPLNFDFRLLRVMNAVTIRLYEFPVEVVRLVHLKYLSLTCNGKLPTSISNLWKLQYLIVKRYMNIRSTSDMNSCLLPVEIWDMKELKHLQVMGGCLPNHKSGAGILNISALLDVSVQSCRKEVLKWIPNLERLGIRIELAPDGDQGNSFHYLNSIYRLYRLRSLKCVVVNPQISSEAVLPIFKFPPSLTELSLSGFGYPWEYMSMIYELSYLQVLKLKNYAFQGPKWEMDFHLTGKLHNLKFLLVEDTNLVHWKLNDLAFHTERICFKHCYKLRELPIAFLIPGLQHIQIVDCNPLTVSWAEQARSMLTNCQVKVHLSWMTHIPSPQNDSQ